MTHGAADRREWLWRQVAGTQPLRVEALRLPDEPLTWRLAGKSFLRSTTMQVDRQMTPLPVAPWQVVLLGVVAPVMIVVAGGAPVAAIALAIFILVAAFGVEAKTISDVRHSQLGFCASSSAVNADGALPDQSLALRFMVTLDRMLDRLQKSQGWAQLTALERPAVDDLRRDFHAQATHLYTREHDVREHGMSDEELRSAFDDDITVLLDRLEQLDAFTTSVLTAQTTARPLVEEATWESLDDKREVIAERNRIMRELNEPYSLLHADDGDE